MFGKLLLFGGLTSLSVYNSTTDVSTYPNNKIFVLDFLKNINDGYRIINDMCETLDEKYSIISGSNKPSCDYNISYINSSDIVLYSINTDIKSFFLVEKKNFCKTEKIECGELTIIIKLLDLINSAVRISFLNSDINDLKLNLQIMDFYQLYNVYKKSLFNNDILTNITLSKQKANVILTKEKNRLYAEYNKASIDRVSDNFNTWIGKPIKNTFTYCGDTVSETIESLVPELTLDVKIIIILVLFLLLKQKC
jgi:hypothetical protein